MAVLTCNQEEAQEVRALPWKKKFNLIAETPILKDWHWNCMWKKLSGAFKPHPDRRICVRGAKKPSAGKPLKQFYVFCSSYLLHEFSHGSLTQIGAKASHEGTRKLFLTRCTAQMRETVENQTDQAGGDDLVVFGQHPFQRRVKAVFDPRCQLRATLFGLALQPRRHQWFYISVLVTVNKETEWSQPS